MRAWGGTELEYHEDGMGEHEGMLDRDGILKYLTGQKNAALFRDQGDTRWLYHH